MKFRTLALIALVLAFAAPAAAQESIKKNTPFTVVADQPAADADSGEATGFRLYINGKAVSTRTAAEAGCNVFPCSPLMPVVGGLTPGSYVLYLEAFNLEGAAQSTTLTLTVTQGQPKPPTGIRIVKGAGGN